MRGLCHNLFTFTVDMFLYKRCTCAVSYAEMLKLRQFSSAECVSCDQVVS